MKQRSHRDERMARLYDNEILPLWSQRFGRMILRGLQVPEKALVLDAGCRSGDLSLSILQQMDAEGRIIAIDPLSPLLDVARKKAGELAGKRIFFRTEPLLTKLSFADNVYDIVVSNLGLQLGDDRQSALQELARVAKPGGQVIITLPLANTFHEFFDIYREVLIKKKKEEMLVRLERYIAQTPEGEDIASWLEAAGLKDVGVDVERYSLLFKSAREFFFAPVIEFGPLCDWKNVAGHGPEMQQIFGFIKDAIDAYFGERVFALTVNAGCFRGTKPAAGNS